MDIEYTLRMNSETAHECLKAVDLLMRLKLGQYKEIPFALLDISKDDFCVKRDIAERHLKNAFDAMQYDKKDDEWKDREWFVLYNTLQALRYQIHLAEYPNSKGVDSYPPMRLGGCDVPECTFSKNEKHKTKSTK